MAKSDRRGGPVDVSLNTRDSGEKGWADAEPFPGPHAGADKDYFGNLEKFKRTDNMAAEPNRNKGNESGQKP